MILNLVLVVWTSCLLVDEYDNIRSIDIKPVDSDYSAFSEEIKSSYKTPKFKVGDTVGITKYN